MNEKVVSPFLKEIYFSDLIGFKCIHFSFFLCWFGLILAGTTIIGFGASNYSLTFDYCTQSENFCSQDISLDAEKELYFYVKLDPFYQNNRFYLDSYSTQQLHGNVGTGAQCTDYKTYSSLSQSETVGGYRVKTSNNVHPCGFPMKTILKDSIYLVNSEGGTPDLDSQLFSDYSTKYHFKRLENYQLKQWTDVVSSKFINWFTVPTTSKKYVLMGKQTMPAGSYQMIVKNVDPTNSQFTKSIIISEMNTLGMTNHLLGFTIFAYGIVLLLFHVALCCKSRK